jgi:hypothetical protein
VPKLGTYGDELGIARVIKSLDVSEWSCSLLPRRISYYLIDKTSFLHHYI